MLIAFLIWIYLIVAKQPMKAMKGDVIFNKNEISNTDASNTL